MISVELYTPFFYYVTLFFVLITYLHCNIAQVTGDRNVRFIKLMGWTLFVFVLLYMGLRPVAGVFGDMTTYNNQFERYMLGYEPAGTKDYIFTRLMYLSAQFITPHQFFFVCSFLYVFPLYIASRKWFKEKWFYALLIIVASFSFWAYGTNGIRNGIATSMFLLAVSREGKLWRCLWLAISLVFHKSLMLPILGFLLTGLVNNPAYYLVFWISAIPLSLFGSSFWEGAFAALPITDQRLKYFTNEVDSSKFSYLGFRWDFLVYSSTGVVLGYYYIFKKKFRDKFYLSLFNTYLFTNAIWILIIRANFSNRFAYLSWFMLPVVLIYPQLRGNFLRKNYMWIGTTILIYYAFTFLMNVIIK